MASLPEQRDCTVIAADSAEAALARPREYSTMPEVMIVDYRLAEGKTVLETINWLHEQLGSSVPAIIVTGDMAPVCIREPLQVSCSCTNP